MRVALVAMETARQRPTDGNRRFARLARDLAADHEVTVFCTRWWEGNHAVFEADDDVRYRSVTAGDSVGWFCTQLPALLASYNPDIIHARPAPPHQVVAASIGGTLARTPLAVEWFGDEQLEDSRMARRAATSPELVVTPSELIRTEVRERGTPDDRVRIIPEAIDFSQIGDAEPADGVDVAFAHPLDEDSNVESLLLGLAELRDRDWRATIIGDGPRRDAAERQASDLRIDDRVTFVGACDRERRLEIYRGAHAFVQTARREQFATELLWALACGCIGIVEYQARSSAHELIENYDRSFRVTNPQQLATAIVDAGQFEHRTLDDRWERYDHANVLEDYLAIYDGLQSTFGLF